MEVTDGTRPSWVRGAAGLYMHEKWVADVVGGWDFGYVTECGKVLRSFRHSGGLGVER